MAAPDWQRRTEALIASLDLAPHPEDGYYRQIFRSSSRVQPLDERPPRPALTTIYFLLTEGAVSGWHRVRSKGPGGAARWGIAGRSSPCSSRGARRESHDGEDTTRVT